MRLTLTVKGSNAVEIRGGRGGMLLPLSDPALRDFLMLLEGEAEGVPVRELCRRNGYRSSASYYRKRGKLLREGLAGLVDQKRGPRGKSLLTDGVIKNIVALRFRSPDRNSQQIADALRQKGMAVSARSVERVLQEFGISRSRRSGNGEGGL